jgi:Flp pilus assembly protein TadG
MRLRRKFGERSGTSAVEMAFVAPIFFTFVLGQIEMSQMGMVTQVLTTAAREGCRVAVVPGAIQEDVQTRVNPILDGAGIPRNSVTQNCPSTSSLNSARGGDAITVSLSVRFADVSWLGTPIFLKDTTIRGSATMSSENP